MHIYRNLQPLGSTSPSLQSANWVVNPVVFWLPSEFPPNHTPHRAIKYETSVSCPNPHRDRISDALPLLNIQQSFIRRIRQFSLGLWTTSLLMEDGRVIIGMIIRESDKEIFLTDAAGKQIHVPREQVAQRKASTRSLMPNRFSQLLTADDFKNLPAYLKASH